MNISQSGLCMRGVGRLSALAGGVCRKKKILGPGEGAGARYGRGEKVLEIYPRTVRCSLFVVRSA